MEIAPNPIPKFPNDIVIEILVRLPVKPLSKFKCVSKSWLTIISSKQFIKTHLAISKQDPNSAGHRIILNCRGRLKQCPSQSLLSEPSIDSFDSDFSSQFSKTRVLIVGSCDGLICLFLDRKELILWNPSTRIFNNLPDFGVQVSRRSHFACGFGFDKSSDDYKVVFSFRSSWDSSGKVYSLKTNQWKAINSFQGRRLMDDPATFANGKLYWIANSDPELKSRWEIVFLDLETEEYGVLEMPEYVKGGVYSRLGASCGSLFVMCSHLYSADVWVNVGIDSWSRVASVPYVYGFLKYSYKKALHVTNNGEVVLICGSKVVVFDSKDCSFRYLVIEDAGVFITSSTYHESLVSPLGV